MALINNISLNIFKSIISTINKDIYDFWEIKFFIAENIAEIIIIDKKNKFNMSNVKISFLPIYKLLNNDYYLPNGLKKLYILNNSSSPKITIIDNLPNDLKKLKLSNINSKLENLPSSLEVLELLGVCNSCLDYLPSSLKTLIIQSNYRGNLDNLPSLKNLFLLSEYTNNLKNLPSGLKFLHINSQANIEIKLPQKIECVKYPEDNNWLRRKLLKLYPKVIYNDSNYEKQIEMYDEPIEFYNININNNYEIEYLNNDSNYDDKLNFNIM